MHESCATSKPTKLQSRTNLRYVAEASTVLFILTSSAESSQFIFKELLLVAWLDKPIITAVFSNPWQTMKLALKAIIARKPAINFGKNEFLDGLDVLRYHVMPSRCQPRAILQYQYLQKVRNGVKPLEAMVTKAIGKLPFPYLPFPYMR